MKMTRTRLVGLMIALLLGIAHSASAKTISFNFGGVLTGFSSLQIINGVSGPLQTPDGTVLVFAPGDPFTGTITFALPGVTTFSGFASFGITVRGQDFGTYGFDTRSPTVTPSAISIRDSNLIAISPYHMVDTGAQVTFLLAHSFDPTMELPAIEDFLGTGSVNFFGQSNFSSPTSTGIGEFSLTGNITEVRLAPEPGPGMLTTAIVLAGLFLARRRLGSFAA